MDGSGEVGDLVCAFGDGGGGHVSHLVPAEEGADAAEEGEFFLFFGDVVECVVHGFSLGFLGGEGDADGAVV